MATITIENVPDSVVKTYGTKIQYSRDFIFPKAKSTEEIQLINYIHSDDYKNDLGESFDNPEAFLADLKKYKN